MNLFQIITVPLTSLGFLWSFVKCIRGPGRHVRMVNGFLALVWAAGTVFIIKPELSNIFANMLGIGRGVDVVLYGFILLAFGYGVVTYYRLCDIRRDITTIVRHIAIAESRRSTNGESPNPDGNDEPGKQQDQGQEGHGKSL